MKYGLTEKGFIRPTYEQIWEEQQAIARSMFGDDINLNENSPQGLFYRSLIWEIANAWQAAEEVYYSAFIDFNEGHPQDLTGGNIGLRRTPAMKAQGTVKFTGTNGVKIPKGTIVQTEEGLQFETVERGWITDGEANVKVEAVLPGECGNLEPDTITELAQNLPGIDEAVTNEAETAEGRDAETDQAFRERHKRSVQHPGQATAGSIEARLMDIVEVWDAYVRENDTNEDMDIEGLDIPPKSIYPIVHFGDDEEIAQVIYENKAGGIQSFAGDSEHSTIIEVTDSKGNTHNIGFDRPDNVEIDIVAEVEIDDTFPGDFEPIEDALEDYINRRGISKNIIYTKLISIVQGFQGIKDVVVLTVSADGASPVTENIDIGYREVSVPGSIGVSEYVE